MGLLDALGSLTIAAGEELPGITKRVDERAQRRVNAAIGQDFELARMDGDVPRMKSIMEGAGTGQYNEGSTEPGSEVFTLMRQGITTTEDDDEEKQLKQWKMHVGLGGQAGRTALQQQYKYLNPNATPEEVKAVLDNYDLDEEVKNRTRAAQLKILEQNAEDKGQWAAIGKYLYHKKTGAVKPMAGSGVDDEQWTEQYNKISNDVRDGKITPEGAIMQMQTALQREFDPDEMSTLKSGLNVFSNAPLKNLSEDGRKKIVMGDALQAIADNALEKLDSPIVQDALGKLKISANYTRFRAWVDGKANMEPEVQEFLQLLGLSTDFISRKMSGAALTPDEREFYSNLIGKPTQDVEAIRTNLQGLLRGIEEEQKTIYELAYAQANYVQGSQEMRDAVSQFVHKSPYVDLASIYEPAPTFEERSAANEKDDAAVVAEGQRLERDLNPDATAPPNGDGQVDSPSDDLPTGHRIVTVPSDGPPAFRGKTIVINARGDFIREIPQGAGNWNPDNTNWANR